MSKIKDILAKNITALRIKNKMTQTELGEKLNYTDKSVSKWEHGDSTPPIDTLKDIADLFGVTVDFLITEDSNLSYDKIYTGKNNTANKIIITSLSVLIVWLIATMLFFYSMSYGKSRSWLIFIHACPISCIVLIVFNSIWGKRKFVFILISALIWTFLTSCFLQMHNTELWAIYLIGAPLQVATILWSQLKPLHKK